MAISRAPRNHVCPPFPGHLLIAPTRKQYDGFVGCSNSGQGTFRGSGNRVIDVCNTVNHRDCFQAVCNTAKSANRMSHRPHIDANGVGQGDGSQHVEQIMLAAQAYFPELAQLTFASVTPNPDLSLVDISAVLD